MSAPEELAAAAKYGRQMAAEMDDRMRQMQSGQAFMLNHFANTEAARRLVQAAGGTEQDVHRLVFQAGDKPLERPRPRLVTMED